MEINTKSYFSIMSILMLIMGILWCCTIIGLIWGIPIIIGSRAMKKAVDYSEKELKENNSSLLVWAIVFGAFTFPAGIIAIVFAILVYNMINDGKMATEVIIDVKPKESEKKDDLKEKLQELETLKAEGLINEKEYQEKRKQILGL